MVRYHNFDVVFAEIPGETTLALNITGCPNRCPGCHSPHLQADEGRVLDEAELLGLLARYGRSVTCVAFMGGDAGPHKIARLAGTVRKTCPELRTAWYSGREELPEDFEATAFDYVKLGGWVEALGPLTASTTNQRLYRVGVLAVGAGNSEISSALSDMQRLTAGSHGKWCETRPERRFFS